MTAYAQCLNAGLRICTDCARNVDNNEGQPKAQHQPMVGATTSSRCANWKALTVHQPARRA